MEQPPPILYKYYVPERIDVIERCLIRYTQPGAFNDPFETRPCLTRVSTPEDFQENMESFLPEETIRAYRRLPSEARRLLSIDFFEKFMRRRIREMIPSLCVVMDQCIPMLRDVIDHKLNELLGILSLTETPDNLLMWSHYAGCHEGYVIGFDATHDYFNAKRGPKDELCHLRKVEYRDQRPRISMGNLTGMELLLVKSTHWAYEREWRIARPLRDADHIVDGDPYSIHLFKFPSGTIREIILGSRMREGHRRTIRRILSTNKDFQGVKVLEATPDGSEFKIVFTQLTT